MPKQKEPEDFSESIYHFNKRIDKEKKLIREAKDITERNKQLILDFCNYRKLKKQNTNSRIYKLLNKLKIIATILKKDFDKVNNKDIYFYY